LATPIKAKTVLRAARARCLLGWRWICRPAQSGAEWATRPFGQIRRDGV